MGMYVIWETSRIARNWAICIYKETIIIVDEIRSEKRELTNESGRETNSIG